MCSSDLHKTGRSPPAFFHRRSEAVWLLCRQPQGTVKQEAAAQKQREKMAVRGMAPIIIVPAAATANINMANAKVGLPLILQLPLILTEQRTACLAGRQAPVMPKVLASELNRGPLCVWPTIVNAAATANINMANAKWSCLSSCIHSTNLPAWHRQPHILLLEGPPARQMSDSCASWAGGTSREHADMACACLCAGFP